MNYVFKFYLTAVTASEVCNTCRVGAVCLVLTRIWLTLTCLCLALTSVCLALTSVSLALTSVSLALTTVCLALIYSMPSVDGVGSSLHISIGTQMLCCPFDQSG